MDKNVAAKEKTPATIVVGMANLSPVPPAMLSAWSWISCRKCNDGLSRGERGSERRHFQCSIGISTDRLVSYDGVK